MADRYWPTLSGPELAAEMAAKAEDYYRFLSESGRLNIWRRSARQFYGLDPEGSYRRTTRVTFGGESGELVFASVNHYASLIHEAHTLVTGSRPAYRAISSAAKHDAYEETLLAQQVMDYDLHHARLEEALKLAGLYQFIFGEGWLLQPWDPWGGEPYAADESGQIVYEGSAIALPLRPVDVIRDIGATLVGDATLEWAITRRRMSRWRLAAHYPAAAQAIMGAPSLAEETQDRLLFGRARQRAQDTVAAYELWHPPSDICPEGRYALMLGATLIAEGGYEDALPVHHVVAVADDDAPFGFSPAWHLLGQQQLLDAAESTAHTNHDQAGGVNWWTPEEHEVDVDDLGGHAKHLRSPHKPELVEVPNVIDQSIRLAEHRQRTMETIIGINSVQRGDPDAQLKSGAALALVQSMAVQHQSNAHAAYGQFTERVMSGRLALYRRHARTERLLQLAGDSTSTVRRWRGEQLGSATRVVVELAEPLSQTSHGRKALADEYADRGWVEGMDQHAEVMRTGRSEPLTKRGRNERRLVGAENERIRQSATQITLEQLEALVQQAALQAQMTGQPPRKPYEVYADAKLIPRVLVTHRHTSVHHPEHLAEASSPEALEDEVYAELLLAHDQWHLDLYEQLAASKPWLLEASGEPLYQMAPPPPESGPPPGPPPGPPDGTPPPVEQAQVPALAENPVGPSPAAMPHMPINPMTGDRAQPGGGMQ